MNTTKQNERKYFLRFLTDKIYNHDFTPIEFTEIIQCANDPPDFIIKTKDKSISLEITNLNIYTGISKRQFSMDNVLKKAIKKIDSELPDRYSLKLGEGLGLKRFEMNEGKLTEQVFYIIKNFKKILKHEEQVDYIDEIRKLKNNRYLINFKNETGDAFGLFVSKIKAKQSNGGVATIAIEYKNNYDIVEKTINKKEKNLPVYKMNYNKNYLLLVADSLVIKGCIFNFDCKFYKHKFKTNFDKIFLMEIDRFNNHKIQELTITS